MTRIDESNQMRANVIEKTTHKLLFVFLSIFAIGGAIRTASTEAVKATSVIENIAAREIDSPAAAGSGNPNLSGGPNGRVYLSWIEPVQSKGPKGYALKFAVRSRGGRWSTPRTITQGENRFDSSILALPDGSLAAYWLTKSGPGMHANDVYLSISLDGGQTWGKAIVPHRDRTPTERGFVSMIPANGGIAIIWLNGPKMTGGDPGAAEHGSADKARAGASPHTGG